MLTRPVAPRGVLVSQQTWFRGPASPEFGTGLSDALVLELRQELRTRSALAGPAMSGTRSAPDGSERP